MVVVVWLVGCGWGEADPEADPEAVVEDVEEPDDEAAVVAEQTEPLAASHVLVAFAGATGAASRITRSETEAAARAQELHRTLIDGADFARTAAEASDDPSSARRGGRVGTFLPDAVAPAFATAVAGIEVGEITEPFRTSYGWHIARRDAASTVRARHILVPYEGALHSSETHNQAHARRMMDMLSTRLDRGADFSELAAEFSRDTTAPHGGDLGPVGEGQLLPMLEEAIRKLEPGQRTYVESPYGWHLVERTQ